MFVLISELLNSTFLTDCPGPIKPSRGPGPGLAMPLFVLANKQYLILWWCTTGTVLLSELTRALYVLIYLVLSSILTLCEHCDCSGQQLVRTDSDPTLVDDGFDNMVSAVRVTGECQWIFYEDSNYGRNWGGSGESSVIGPGDHLNATFGIPDDELSSLRCLPASSVLAIALFQHSLYRGNMRVLYSPSEDLGTLENTVSSFIIISGLWQLFSGRSYTGLSVTRGVGQYPTSCHLSPVGNDDLSSVRLGKLNVL